MLCKICLQSMESKTALQDLSTEQAEHGALEALATEHTEHSALGTILLCLYNDGRFLRQELRAQLM